MTRRGSHSCLVVLCILGLQAATPALAGLTYYVDDDAPNDPGPYNPGVSDPLEVGSPEHPFDSVQEALSLAGTDDTVQLLPGAFEEDVQLPARGCTLLGSGSPVTRVRSASASLATVSPDPAARLIVRGLRLEGGMNLFAGLVPVIGDTIDVTVEDVVFGAGSLIGMGGAAPWHLGMHTVSVQGGDIILSVGCGNPTTTELVSFTAPSSMVMIDGCTTAAPQLLTIRDGTVAGLSRTRTSFPLTASLQNVGITGNGIVVSGGLLDLSIEDSTFEHGGLQFSMTSDRDLGSATDVRISRCTFKERGVEFSVWLQPNQLSGRGDIGRLRIDSSAFLGQGVTGSIGHSFLVDERPETVDIELTNNVFASVPEGFSLEYVLPNAQLNPARPRFRSALVNNTFAGCATGVSIETIPHVPGQDTIITLLQNNVIANGDKGIAIFGLDDHLLTVAGNDVFGNAQGDYLGALPNQTGLNGNISANPQFLNPPARDFHLAFGSPCVDAGVVSPDVPAVDHDGTMRPLDGDLDGVSAPDIGAYEFVAGLDGDGDGYPAPPDCVDDNPAIHPGAVDFPGNALDEDCSGTATCDSTSFWRSHGQFVSCVSHACKTLVMSGLVSKAQCDTHVSQASESSVGRRQRFRQPPVPLEP